jgi:hypothetical protein
VIDSLSQDAEERTLVEPFDRLFALMCWVPGSLTPFRARKIALSFLVIVCVVLSLVVGCVTLYCEALHWLIAYNGARKHESTPQVNSLAEVALS